MGTAVQSVFATLFPADCRLCASPLLNISRLPVCEDCLAAIHPITAETCALCGERIFAPGPHAVSSSDREPRCEMCLRVAPVFARAAAYGSYDGGLRDLIHLLKYEQVRPAANVLGRLLAKTIDSLAPAFRDAPVLLVPVPLHRSKLRQRGFNQAELTARAALQLSSVRERLSLRPNALLRTRPTQSQIGLTRHQRRENMRGAFAVAKPAEIAGREILLVDDVFTTGTTASECARILRRQGASNVWVATVARTLKLSARLSAHETEAEIGLAAAG